MNLVEKLVEFVAGLGKGEALVAGLGGGALLGVRKVWTWMRRKKGETEKSRWEVLVASKLARLEGRMNDLSRLEHRMEGLSSDVVWLKSEAFDRKQDLGEVRVTLEKVLRELDSIAREVKELMENLEHLEENERKGGSQPGGGGEAQGLLF